MDPDFKPDEKWEESEEELAHEYATEMIEKTIINCKAEVPALEDFPFFREAIPDILEMEENQEWKQLHKKRLEDGIVYEDENDIFDSIIDYFISTSENDYENRGAPVEIEEKEEKEEEPVKIPTVQKNLFDTMILAGDARKGLVENTEPTKEESASVQGNDGDDDVPWYTNDDNNNQQTGGVMNPFEDGFVTKIQPTVKNTNQAKTQACAMQASIPVPEASEVGKLDMLRNIYTRLAEHAHQVCGFSNGTFTNPAGVMTPLELTEEEKASNLILGSKTTLADGSIGYADAKNGKIYGLLFCQGTLPAYDLLVNWAGTARKVRIVMQNAQKNSEYALRARSGERIAWVIDADEEDKSQAFKAKIINGRYEAV